MTDETNAEARRILDQLVATPFNDSQPVSRTFDTIPARPGVYAVRHRTVGLLYIGKTKNLCTRFVNGHKAFLWAWLAQYSDHDIRIAVSPLSQQLLIAVFICVRYESAVWRQKVSRFAPAFCLLPSCTNVNRWLGSVGITNALPTASL